MLIDIPLLKGEALDTVAFSLGLKRKIYFWFIKEPDKLLRKRLEKQVYLFCNSNVTSLHCKVCRGVN